MADQRATPARIADAIVVGAGVSGLTAAYDLARAGRDVRLIESRPRAGGLVRTDRVDGLTIEAGPDALLMQKPAAGLLCAELGLPLVPTQTPRTAFVLRGGHLIQLPHASVLGLPTTWRGVIGACMLSPAGRARMARDLLGAADEHAEDGSTDRHLTDRGTAVPRSGFETDQSVGAFVRRRFGDEAARYLAQPLLGGIHAGDVDRLSLGALFPALAEADRQHGSVMRTLAARRSAGDPDGAFRTIPGGLGELIAALVRRLPPDALLTNTTVTRIERIAPRQPAPPGTAPRGAAPNEAAASEGIMAHTGDRETGGAAGVPHFLVHLSAGEVLLARTLVLALPAYAAADLVAPLDGPLAGLCREIAYASSATITLAYRRAAVGHALAGTGFVVPRGERETRLLAVSWVTSKWAGRAPDDVVALRAFAGGTLDADLMERDDDDLAAGAHADLAPLLALREPPFLRRVYRWWRASPQYEVGHQARIAAIESRQSGLPGLFLTGSAFRGVGIPDTVTDARRTAAEVHRWLGSSSRC